MLAVTVTLDPASDSGPFNSDRITNVVLPTFSGEADSGAVAIDFFVNASAVALAVPVLGGAWSYAADAAEIFGIDGTYTITVRSTDADSNLIEESAPLKITIDRTPPTVSKAQLAPASDSGNLGDGITNIKQPALQGQAEAGSSVSVTLTRTGSPPVPLVALTDLNGDWTVTPSAPLDDGVWSVAVVARDVAGNQQTAPTPNYQFVILSAPPATPSPPDLVPTSDRGVANDDNLTNDTTPTFKGTVQPGTSTVELFVINPSGVYALLAQGVPVEALTGDWSYAVLPEQAFSTDGVYQISVRAIDVAGNASDESVPLEITLETIRPKLLTVEQPATPRTTAVESIKVSFDEELFGLALGDVVLEYRVSSGGNPLRLTLAGPAASIVKNPLNPLEWTIQGLTGYTGSTGIYSLRMAPRNTVFDLAGNVPVAPTLPTVTWTTDVDAPWIVSFGPVSPQLRNTPVTSVVVTFNEAVTGVDLSDFELRRDGIIVPLVGSGANVTGSGKSWSINGLGGVTTPEGSYTLTIMPAGSGINDSFGNTLAVGDDISWTMMTTAPTGVFVPVGSVIGAGLDAVTLQFTGPVTGLSLSDFKIARDGVPLNLGLATLSPGTGLAAQHILTGLAHLTAIAGDYEVFVNVGGTNPVRDEVGNLVAPVPSLLFTVDTEVPFATWTGIPTVTSAPVATATLSFNLPVAGVDASDIVLTRTRPDGTIDSLTGFLVSSGGTTWDVDFGGLTAVDGTYRLRLVAGGSGIVRSTLPANPLLDDAIAFWKQDATAPTVALSLASWNGSTKFSVRALFSEAVTGLELGDPQVGGVGGVVSNLQAIGTSGREYRYDVTLPAAPTDPAFVTLPVGVANDAAGNPNSASNTLLLKTDFTAPRVILEGPATTNASPFEVTATFTEPVTGLGPDDVVISNGQVLAVDGAGTTYTLSIQPNAEGVVTLSLKNGAAVDASGNLSAASNIHQTRYDSTRPTVTLTSLSGSISNASELQVAVKFSEPVTGLTADDFVVTNGVATGLLGSSDSYVLLVTPNAQDPAGIFVFVELAADLAEDLAGNPTEAATPVPVIIRADSVPPTVTMTWSSSGLVTLAWSETISGLDLSDFELTRDGSAISLRGATLSQGGSPTIWELNIAGAVAAAGPGQYRLRIVNPGSGIADDAGNPFTKNIEANFFIDGVAPTATWLGIPSVTTTPLDTAVLKFSEWVVGVSTADIVVLRDGVQVVPPGSLTITPAIGFGDSFTIGGLASSTSIEGQYEIRLSDSPGIVDQAGNPLQGNAVATWTLNTTRPEASFGPISVSPRLPAVFSTDIFFTEPVKGFDGGDLQLFRDGLPVRLTGVRASAIGTSNTQFRIADLSTHTRLTGSYMLVLRAAESGITDMAGNPLLADASVSWTNTGAPSPGPLTATIQAVTPNPRSSPVDSITVAFSAVATGVDASDFVLARTDGGITTPLTGFTVVGTGSQRKVGGLLPLTDAPGQYTLRLKAAGSGVASIDGQPLLADAMTTWTRLPGPVVAPAVTLVAGPVERFGAAVDSVSLVFNTAVTGLGLADFRLTRNGSPVSLSGAVLSGSGGNYHLRALAVIAAAPGTYELRLLASGSGITDGSGHPLAADGLVSWTVLLDEVRAAFLAVESDRTVPLAGVRLRFSVPVLRVDVSDFELTRNGVAVPLYGVTVLGQGTSWVVSNLTGPQTGPGTYVLRLRAAGSGIISSQEKPLAEDALVTWEVW
jgi:hypothetical protein